MGGRWGRVWQLSGKEKQKQKEDISICMKHPSEALCALWVWRNIVLKGPNEPVQRQQDQSDNCKEETSGDKETVCKKGTKVHGNFEFHHQKN